MTIRPRLAWLALPGILGVLLSAPAARAATTELQIEAPTSARMGAPLRIVAAAPGAPDNLRITLYYRAKGSPEYTRCEMMPIGPDRHAGDIPAHVTKATELRYYVEARDREGARLRVGSPEHPLPLILFQAESEPDKGGFLFKLFLVPASIAPIVLLIWRRERQRGARLRDQLFWARKLGPLVNLPGRAASEQIELMARVPLQHPVSGTLVATKESLLARLEEVRRIDFARLEQDRRRYLGPSVPALAPPPPAPSSEVKLEDQLAELAARISQVSAAAWFLAHARGRNAAAAEEMVQPLINCLEATRRLKAQLKDSKQQPDKAELERIKCEVERLQKALAAAEAGTTAEDVSLRLTSGSAITPDVLGRLVEYYARLAPRTAENRRKLLRLATALVERDSGNAASEDGVRESLGRRKLLASTAREALPQSLVNAGATLTRQIQDCAPRTAADLEPLQHRLEALGEAMGKYFYSLAGVAVAVAIETALEHKREALERSDLGALDASNEEIDVSFLAGTQTLELLVQQIGDPAVTEHLEILELELRESVDASAHQERGFFLEESELVASTPYPTHPRWAALVVRAATCRTAIDRLARRHARAAQPDGQEPPELPRDFARGLLRSAVWLETDLQEQLERDLRHAETERAKETSRIIQRLSRARLGLAVLGGFPATGVEEETSTGEPALVTARAAASTPTRGLVRIA